MSNSETSRFNQGYRLKSTEPEFGEGIRAVVDYRGDVTILKKSGIQIIGYVFNATAQSLDLFPRDSSRKETVAFTEIDEIEFSGEDTARGKSWEDWVKKKAQTAAKEISPSL